MYYSFLLLFLIGLNSYAQEYEIKDNYVYYKDKKFELSQIKDKCKEPKFKNVSLCLKLKDLNEYKDPFFKDKNTNKSYYVLQASFGVLGSTKGYNFEVQKTYENLGFGLFFLTSKTENNNSIKLIGNGYGASIRYNFYNTLLLEDSKIQPSLQLNLGQLNVSSSYQGKLPKYIYGDISLDLNYKIQKLENNKYINSYIRINNSNIYHSESGILNYGNQISIGISFGY